MMRLTKLWTMSLGCGPGSSTAISSTAVSSTLGSSTAVSSTLGSSNRLPLSFLILCKNTKIIHLLAYPKTKSC